MSEDRYPVKVIRNVLIPMRDGVKLAADIARPDAEGKFPAIMQYSPYHKGVPSGLADRGYVQVAFDVRGTGDSEGSTTDIYSPQEIQDACEVVEWIAHQPWCNGNVGMWGISYCGVVCWQVAMHNLPHLKAIIVRSGTDDVYTEWTNPGGSPRPYMYEFFVPFMSAMNFGPPNIELCGERWAEIWNQHLENNVPWGIGFIKHLLDGPYWRARSVRPDYDRIKCPVFVIGGWADWYPTPLLRAFSNLKVPKKALIGPWCHYWPANAIPGPRIDHERECLKWFDQWLKGIDTGVLDEPPVAIFVREYSQPDTILIEDKGFFRSENEWPLARTKQTPIYLYPHGLLSSEPYAAAEAESDEYEYNPTVGWTAGRHGGGAFPPWGMPTDQRPDEVHSLTYTTTPLEEDLEVTGHPRAIIYVSSTADIAFFSVKLCDVAPDGTSALVTKGFLNATHRTSHAEPSPLEPGKVYELQIDLLALAYIFKAGHRIRLDIASADFGNAWPTPKPAVNAVHRGRQYPSRIILPVASPQSPELPKPDLKPSPCPLPKREAIPKPEYTVTHDIINGTTTSSYQTKIGGPNCARFTVSSKDPAEAVVKATYQYAVKRPEMEISVEAQCVTVSDLTTFHHLVEVEIKVNGKRHFNRSWSVSVPREFV